MNINWFFSRTLRHAIQMRKHVRRLVHSQRDLLSPAALDAMGKALQKARELEGQGASAEALASSMKTMETEANKWLKPYPHAGWRENVEVLLVAIAVAVGIRTFFLQPFKIPTGSMQPTLYGITHEPYLGQPDMAFPSWWNPSRLFGFWFSGVGYVHEKAKVDGRIEWLEDRPSRFLFFNLRQRFRLGGVTHTVWFPPEELWRRAGLASPHGEITSRPFKQGDDVIKIKVVSGDHLFVDRMSYNFRRPRRGEIIVFETRGISRLRAEHQDQFYIKRLVALGDERVRIGNDRHLVIDGKRLDASTPHFELVYSFDGPPRESHFSGHVNGTVAERMGLSSYIAPLFPDENTEYRLKPNHYMVMGDNTLNSSDSRYWGEFQRENVIGKSFFVYWPIGSQPDRMGRFGWSHR